MQYLVIIIFLFLFLGYETTLKKVYVSADTIRTESNNGYHLKKKVVIPGGHYQEPYVISNPDTEYVLNEDITADGTAILIKASKIVLNLNGKKILYNQKIPGDGVAIGEWNKTDITITNGSVIQGAALSEGDQYGVGNNPLRTTPFYVEKLRIANVHVRYGGRDVGGIIATASNSIFENNIIEDLWTLGTLKNRHQGVDALAGSKHSAIDTNNIYRNNSIVRCRHRGISMGNKATAYNNKVVINSLATNSTGIAIGRDSKVYKNTIIGEGEHPIGIFYVFKEGGVDIYNNTIDVQTTRIGDEYEAGGGNFAVGFRTTWGGNNINFHDNTITVRTDAAFKGSRSSTGAPVVVNGKGRGLMVGVNAGESAKFSNNTISVLDKDGKGKAFGIACTGGNVGEMVFEGNVVTSNILNVALGDEYGACGGHPLFIRNTFIKSGNFPRYQTVASELGGYFEGTGKFVANIYKEGASQENININAAGQGQKSVYFGRELTVQLQANSERDTTGAAFKLVNGGDTSDLMVKLDSDRKAKLFLYDYELHNRESKSVKTQKFASQAIQLIDGSEIFSTKPGALSLMSEKPSSSKSHLLDLYKVDVAVSDFKVLVSF